MLYIFHRFCFIIMLGDKMLELRSNYISVRSGAAYTYGGSQTLSQSAAVRRCGCGLIAAVDLILYLCRSRDLPSPVPVNVHGCVDLSDYDRFISTLRRFMPIVPPFGINGAMLSAGLQIAMKVYGLDYSVRLCVSGEKLFDRIREMLERDCPVILAVGPNFPQFWGKNRLRLYQRSGEACFPAASTKAHFVTVTGIDDDWCKISSWGRELYINIPEYKSYVRQYSNSLLSNIIMLK